MKRILIISHDASLTGAPILLLHFLRLLKSKYNFKILLKKGGVLEEEFKAIANTVILKSSDYSEKKNLGLKIVDRLIYFFRLIRSTANFYQSDLIFTNTVANGRLLKYFKFLHKPVISYVHELESVLQYFSKTSDTQITLSCSSIILFPSLMVKDNLIKNHAISIEKLEYLPYYFPPENFNYSKVLKGDFRNNWIKRWNLPDNAQLIVGMGVVSLRKGTDKFIEIAERVILKNKRVVFFWIGEFDSTLFSQEIFQNTAGKKYHDRLIFTGKLDYAYTNLMPFDLFFLSSIEDPYPLVALEAAYQAVPTLYFEGAGGTSEWCGNNEGYIMRDQSVDAVAETILSLLNHEAELIDKGINARKKVLELHSNQEAIFEVFDKVVNKTIG